MLVVMRLTDGIPAPTGSAALHDAVPCLLRLASSQQIHGLREFYTVDLTAVTPLRINSSHLSSGRRAVARLAGPALVVRPGGVLEIERVIRTLVLRSQAPLSSPTPAFRPDNVSALRHRRASWQCAFISLLRFFPPMTTTRALAKMSSRHSVHSLRAIDEAACKNC